MSQYCYCPSCLSQHKTSKKTSLMKYTNNPSNKQSPKKPNNKTSNNPPSQVSPTNTSPPAPSSPSKSSTSTNTNAWVFVLSYFTFYVMFVVVVQMPPSLMDFIRRLRDILMRRLRMWGLLRLVGRNRLLGSRRIRLFIMLREGIMWSIWRLTLM